MNATADNTDNPRPFGYWLTALDRLMAAEFAAAFENEGITRRDWRLLNVIDGSVDSDRPLPAHKLGRLIERGWLAETDGDWALTDEGRAAKERLGVIVDGIRAKVADAVPADDLATTIATLEQLSVAFGWEEGMRLPRGHRKHGHRKHGRRGFGPHGFGRAHRAPHGRGERDVDGHGRRGHDDGAAFAHAHHGRGFGRHGRPGFDGAHARHDDHGFDGEHGRGEFAGHRHAPHDGAGHPGFPGGRPGRARVARMAQGAYERGFDAGFSRGRES